jgi:hypothetical protein
MGVSKYRAQLSHPKPVLQPEPSFGNPRRFAGFERRERSRRLSWKLNFLATEPVSKRTEPIH